MEGNSVTVQRPRLADMVRGAWIFVSVGERDWSMKHTEHLPRLLQTVLRQQDRRRVGAVQLRYGKHCACLQHLRRQRGLLPAIRQWATSTFDWHGGGVRQVRRSARSRSGTACLRRRRCRGCAAVHSVVTPACIACGLHYARRIRAWLRPHPKAAPMAAPTAFIATSSRRACLV